jgi:hypothetical protein
MVTFLNTYISVTDKEQRQTALLPIYRVARSRLTHFTFEYCACAIAYRGWREWEW